VDDESAAKPAIVDPVGAPGGANGYVSNPPCRLGLSLPVHRSHSTHRIFPLHNRGRPVPERQEGHGPSQAPTYQSSTLDEDVEMGDSPGSPGPPTGVPTDFSGIPNNGGIVPGPAVIESIGSPTNVPSRNGANSSSPQLLRDSRIVRIKTPPTGTMKPPSNAQPQHPAPIMHPLPSTAISGTDVPSMPSQAFRCEIPSLDNEPGQIHSVLGPCGASTVTPTRGHDGGAPPHRHPPGHFPNSSNSLVPYS